MVDFFKDFTSRASFLSAGAMNKDDSGGSIYTSNNGQIVIQYVDEIFGKNGEPRKTSMRVNNKTGVMELAKKYILKYTVPERIAILLHELNKRK